MRNLLKPVKNTFSLVLFLTIILSIHGICLGSDYTPEKKWLSTYTKWKSVGKMAADKALTLIQDSDSKLKKENLVIMTNAGYSEDDGIPTQGALDGLAEVTGASRGRNTLVEVHSSPWTPLWFAFYDKGSGYCAYLEVKARGKNDSGKTTDDLFAITSVERIDADYLCTHADEYNEKFEKKIFGGNEFRIITIANAIAKGAPGYAVRSFEFHDHFCPGVTSGILMANYIMNNFPPDDKGYFIQSVTPWCKEDALQVMLNVTLGKSNYSIYHPSDTDLAARKPDFKAVSTIVYRHNNKTDRWQGIALIFIWGETNNPATGNGIIDKMSDALWYLDHIDKPEDFIEVAKTFELPKDIKPEDWARSGVDPLEKISALPEKTME
jgi:formylmethanofuran dehydrogenase subunit E-like metal-binding protein